MQIPPNVIFKMLEKFIALETQPRTPWLLLQGKGNTEGGPFGQTLQLHASEAPSPSSPWPHTHSDPPVHSRLFLKQVLELLKLHNR